MIKTIVTLLILWTPCSIIALDMNHRISNSQEKINYYGIIIDAGSSGSRVHLYQQNSKYDIKEIGPACKIKIPLTEYKNNPDESHVEILKCLEQKPFTQLKGKEDKTMILLGATAGMRLLSYYNYQAFIKILKSLQKNLHQLPYKKGYISDLTGGEEAFYAWITVNHLNGYFNNPSSNRKSVGALDLGGASTQITFENINEPEFQFGTFIIPIFGKEYKVYGISLLCFGMDMIKIRILAEILKENNFASECDNPCSQTGDVIKVPKNVIFQIPCVYGDEEEFGINIPPPNNAPNEFTFKGNVNMAKCENYILKAFESKQAKKARKLLPVQVPQQKFYAMSGYYYTVKALKLPPKHTKEEFKTKLNENCMTPAGSEVIADTNYKTHIKWTCLAGIYVEKLLQFLKVSHMWNNIDFSSKVNDNEVNWALGYMIRHLDVLKS